MNRDAALTLASQAFVVLCGLATSVITARLLGPDGRGDYFVVVTFASLLVQFGNLGIHSSNTYLAARDASLVRGLTANSLWLATAAGMAALAILLAGPWTGWPPEGRQADYWLGCALVPPTLFCLLGGSLLVGGQRFARFNAFQIGSHLLVLAALAIAAASGAGRTGVLCASAAAWWCCAVVLYVLIARTSGGSWRFEPRLLREGVGFAGKAYLSCLVGYLLARANVLLLDHLQNPQQIGYYSVAVQVADAMCLLPGSVGLVLLPRLVRQQHSRWETSSRLLVRVGLLMGGACR
jgi:O-antigen/teichoic acid export membrane protein